MGLCLIASKRLLAQQDPMFNQYMFNTLAINPAYAGSREVLSMVGLYRNQWQLTGINGAPVTMTFSAHSPFAKDKVGLGINIMTDHIARVINTTTINGSYAYKLKFKKGSTLALGLQFGVTHFNANLPDLVTNYNPNVFDPAFSSVVNRWLPNFGFGMYYYTNKYYLGVSLPRIMTNRLTAQSATNLLASDPIKRAQEYRHFFAMAGYVFDIGQSFKLRPSVLMKYVSNAPIEFDFNANLWMFERFAVGASYRTAYGMVGMVQLQATPQMMVGYSYDYPFNDLNKATWGSHEIMLRYELNFSKTRIITPRYF